MFNKVLVTLDGSPLAEAVERLLEKLRRDCSGRRNPKASANGAVSEC
jgi:hypothetical protein